ncbi:hypothetical protein AB0E44_00150 [Micrococcus terreus]|uniref:hypothetical protein n=1 Tax=Micrococcus terreus TaxID=574650 RepID=UPI003409A6DB
MLFLALAGVVAVLSIIITIATNPVNFFFSVVQTALFLSAALFGAVWYFGGDPGYANCALWCCASIAAWLFTTVLRSSVRA